MKRFKIFCVLMILFFTMTNSIYALQQQQIVSVGKHSFIINEEVAKSENIKVKKPTIELTNEETKEHNLKGIILNGNGTTEEATVIEKVYKKNTLSTSGTAIVSAELADLSMNSLTAEVQPFEVGETANFEFEMANYGGTTAYNTMVRVIVDNEDVGGLITGNILPGYVYTFTLMIDGITEGTHEIELDIMGNNLETDYSNNNISEDFVWQGVPDLVAKTFYTVSGDTSFVEGESVAFRFSVKNEGTGMAEGIDNYILVNGQELAILSYPNLDVGYTLTCSFTLTFNSPGDYTLQLYVNKDHSIVESNYNNNTKTKAVAIISESAYLDFGWPTTTVPIQPYSYNDVWQPAMDASISNWNDAGVEVTFVKDSSCDNIVIAESRAEDWYGINSVIYNGSELVSFDITLNSRTISRDATNVSNFIQSVFVHELGHSIWLRDNPPTTSPSIMSHSRDRDTMTDPQTYDINAVNAKY